MSAALLHIDGWGAARVRAVATLRHGAGVSLAPFDSFNLGDRCGDDPEAVAANRATLVELAGLPSAPIWLRQVHGTRVVRVGGDASAGIGSNAIVDVGSGAAASGPPEADAAVTSEPGVVLAVLSADCVPVVFAARDGSEVAVAHAGWRGLAAGVLEATLAAMRTPAGEVEAWLGAAAGGAAYEVGEEVRDAMRASFLPRAVGEGSVLRQPHSLPCGAGEGWGGGTVVPERRGSAVPPSQPPPASQGEGQGVVVPGRCGSDVPPSQPPPAAQGEGQGVVGADGAFVATRAGHWLCDLYALARMRLGAAGVRTVRGGGLCTITTPGSFFSHRRDNPTGRQATLVWLALPS